MPNEVIAGINMVSELSKIFVLGKNIPIISYKMKKEFNYDINCFQMLLGTITL